MNTAQFISIFNSGGNPLGPFQERVEADGGTVEGLDNMLAKYDASASWQLIPTAVKAGTAYAQVPNTSLGDLTVTRASSGTFTNSAGVVQTAASNVLRTDYRNADGTLSATGRYLLEPQRTNSVPYSEQFDNAAWEKVSSTITSNTTTAPSGTLSADLFVPASGSTGRVAETTNLAVVNTTVYTGSIYFKKPALALDNITFYVSDTSAANGANRFGVAVNLTNLTGVAYNSGNGAATSVSVIPVGDGWYRAIFTGSVSSGATLNWAFAARVLTVNASVDGINGLQLWGAQLETGAYATTYIPTTTAAVTRLADVAKKTGVSSLIGQTEGVLFVDINTQARASYTYSAIFTSSSNFIGIATSNTFVQMDVIVSGATQASIRLNNSENRQFKMAAAYKANDFVFYVNGVQVGTDTSGSIPSMSSIILFDSSIGNANALYYNQAALFTTRLTNAQLAELTTL